jgi:ketosteroid isomerase-like protein
VTDDRDFESFLRARDMAARAFLQGDADPLNAAVATTLSVSFFEPGGAVIQSAEEVRARYRKNAARFSEGTYSLEILHSECDGSLGYVVGIQRSEVSIHRGPRSILELRVTEVFRREDGQWKLVHRHADPVSSSAVE